MTSGVTIECDNHTFTWSHVDEDWTVKVVGFPELASDFMAEFMLHQKELDELDDDEDAHLEEAA
jgi:hypothetical protein